MKIRNKAILGLAATLLTASLACGVQAEEDVSADAGDGLYASVQTEKDSPDWVKALPQAQDEAVKQLFISSELVYNKALYA